MEKYEKKICVSIFVKYRELDYQKPEMEFIHQWGEFLRGKGGFVAVMVVELGYESGRGSKEGGLDCEVG